MIRGIYSKAEDQVFKEGVPTFDTIEECMQWMKENAQNGSNPDDPNLRHSLSHLIDWEQVQKYLVEKLVKKHRAKPENGKLQKKYLRGKNTVYSAKEFKPVVNELISRLDLSFYSQTNSESTMNTLKYLFHHMRCGIFVCIRDNDLKMFVPFVNKDYTNTWGDKLRTDPEDLQDYYREKRHHYRRENIIQDKVRCRISFSFTWFFTCSSRINGGLMVTSSVMSIILPGKSTRNGGEITCVCL